MDETLIIDQTALVRLERIGGSKLVSQMIRLYQENAEERLAQMDRGLGDGGTLKEAADAAHSLKSSAANVGAEQVRGLAARMEEVARAGDDDETRRLRTALGAAVAEARSRLDTLLEGMDG